MPAGTGKIRFSSDDRFFACVSGDLIRVWELPILHEAYDSETLQEQPLFRNIKFANPNSWVVFSPDGLHLAQIGEPENAAQVRTTWVCSSINGQQEGKNINLPGILCSGAFSPDSMSLALATDNCQVRIYNWRTAVEICPAVVLPSRPEGLAYAPDGKAVAVH